jgi:hypothetical protein
MTDLLAQRGDAAAVGLELGGAEHGDDRAHVVARALGEALVQQLLADEARLTVCPRTTRRRDDEAMRERKIRRGRGGGMRT